MFEQRVITERIRDGHGDLHAQSICQTADGLAIFDCLEFSARYRCADVAAEVAFLAMDLDHYGRPDLGWFFINEYVKQAHDPGVHPLLDFYKCYRAFVRGKVTALRLAQAGPAEEERRLLQREARAYFDLALRYTGALPQPLLITMSGLPASGKSTLARSLSRRLGLRVLSTDVIRKEHAGLQSTEHLTTPFGTGLYTPATTRATYAALRRAAGLWLRRGVGVVLDGTYTQSHERVLARSLARRTGAHFFLVTTTCSDEVARERLAKRLQDPMRVSDATWETYNQMRASLVRMEGDGPLPLAQGGLAPEEQAIIDQSGGADDDTVVAALIRGGTR